MRERYAKTPGPWAEGHGSGRGSLGGSEAAAAVGASPWMSPFALWCRKTGRLPPKEESEGMRLGRDLEDYVARRWCQVTGKKVRRQGVVRRNPRYPWAHGHIDRWVCGEQAGLECKTTTLPLDGEALAGTFPRRYYHQCLHYLALTGAQRWYLGVLVLGRGFYTFVLERDEEEIAALMKAEYAFWKLVERDCPPPVDGSQVTAQALAVLYPQGEACAVLEGMEEQLEEYVRLKGERRALDERITLLENQCKAALKGARRGVCEGFSVTWSGETRRVFRVRRC